MHILPLIFAFKSFLHIKLHQPYEKDFMAHLETIAVEKPKYACGSGIEDIKWIDIKNTLKVIWRKYHKKGQKLKLQDEVFLTHSQKVFKSYKLCVL